MSALLNKNNAQQHCLTCLVKLDIEEPPTSGEDETQQLPSSISIVDNEELQQLLAHYLDWPVHKLNDLPQQLCIDCHRQLQSFDKFCTRARLCCEQLLSELEAEKVDTSSTFEIIYEQTQSHQSPSVFEEAAADDAALLETQSVLLSREVPSTEASLPPAASQAVAQTGPDPFDAVESKTSAPAKSNGRRCKRLKNSFKCEQCQHSFAHTLTLNAHVRKVHEGSKRPYQCDRCERAYSFIGGLYTHIKEIHEPQERRYICDQAGCERIYTSFIAMQKHKRLKHSAVQPVRKYICEQCGAIFNQTANLKYHRRSKHPTEAEAAEQAQETEQHFCELCQKQFHSRYTLKYHTMQQHSGEQMQYECKVCGRRVAKRFMLVQHMLMHSAEKMPCEHCGKLFVRKFELEAHIRAVHLKLKPFACKFCAECFASRKTLRHHEYIHTGEKPYVCDVCGQAYRQQTCLKNHRKTHAQEKGASTTALANV